MVKDTGIQLDEKDRKDLTLCFQAINTANRMIDSTPGVDLLSDTQLENYLTGLCQVLIESRVTLHHLRKEFSKKYNIPYYFIYNNGKIYLEKQ